MSEVTPCQTTRVGPKLLQVLDLHITPLSLKVLRYQAAMAMMGFLLAAQKAAAVKFFAIPRFYSAACHQVQKLLLIDAPRALRFLVFVEHALRRGQRNNVVSSQTYAVSADGETAHL